MMRRDSIQQDNLIESGSGLKRTLGLPLLSFYGVGMILGAGIYTIIGKAAGEAGESVWISVLIAAVAAVLTALSYAELGSMFPRVGGEYVYLKEAFPKIKWLAGSGGLMMAFASLATASTVALSFAGYLEQFVFTPPVLTAYCILLLFTALNILGIKESSWINVTFTLIETFGLILFIYFGIKSPGFGEALHQLPSSATISASALIIFAYFGFENMVNFVEETKNPEKTLPKAILLSLTITSLLYFLVALAAVNLLPVEQLAKSGAPLSDALRPISSKAAGALGGIALFATANTILISLITASRILFGMSRDGVLPRGFHRLTKRRQTPWLSALVSLTIAAILVPLGAVEVLAAISSFATMIAFTVVNGALIILRIRRPDIQRSFRSPLQIGKIPILAVLGALATVFLLFQFDPFVYLVGGGFLFFILASQMALAHKRDKKKNAETR